MYEMLGQLHFGYGFPNYYTTENVVAVRDQVGPDGQVEDPARVMPPTPLAVGLGSQCHRCSLFGVMSSGLFSTTSNGLMEPQNGSA